MKKYSLLTIALICLLFSILGLTVSAQNRTPTSGIRPREVAITFDDLPASHGDLEGMSYVTNKLVQSIKANNIPAIGFVNESKLYRRGEMDARVALLQMWLDAGVELGNHTFSHVSIGEVPLERYQEEIIRGETVTRRMLRERGMNLRYFRHTQLRTGPTLEYKKGLEQFLASRGYTIAPVTIDNQEFIFAAVYSDAKERGDREAMRRIAESYIPYMKSSFDFYERLSVDFLGREVKQVLLLHANELNADYFDELVRMMKKRGYTFITLEQALTDEAYKLPDAQTTRGLSWLHRWMLAKGMQMRPEPSEPQFITQLFNERQRRTPQQQSVALSVPARQPQNENADRLSDAAREILALDREWADAIVRGDVTALNRLFADDMILTDSNGNVRNKSQEIDSLRPSTDVTTYFFNTDDRQVRVHGDAAVLTGRATWRIRSQGRDIDNARRYTSMYARQNGRWRIVAQHLTRIPAQPSR